MKRKDINEAERLHGGGEVLARLDAAATYEPAIPYVPADGNGQAEASHWLDDVERGPPLAPPPLPPEPPEAADVFELLQTSAPPRLWHVQDWIPAHDVTLLGGDGGTGKTLLALMLGYATAYGWSWLDKEVMQCPVIYYGAEEPMKELHYRLERVAEPLASVARKPGQFQVISVAHTDAELITFDEGKPQKPEIWHQLEAIIRAMKAGLLILDAQADVFGGNEINRREVRSFIRELRGIAMRNSCTILLLAHPSVDGIKTGRGYSGSTHWNNSVRSRLYFTTPKIEGNVEIDQDLRELTVMKANRAAKGTSLMLRWRDDTFVVETGVSVACLTERAHVNSVFLDLLRTFNARPEHVTITSGRNYAPAVFEQAEGAQGIKRKAFQNAMRFLLDARRIEIVETGPVSKRRKYLQEVSKIAEAPENAT